MALAKSILILVILAGLEEIRVHGQDDVLQVMGRQGFSRFRKWMENIKAIYAGGGERTVFAFNDSVYNTVPSQSHLRTVLDRIDSNTALQTKYVMTYTILDIKQRNELVAGASSSSRTNVLISANGNKIFATQATIYSRGTSTTTGVTNIYINGAKIIGQPISASNGLVYYLDRPPDLPSKQNVYEWIMNNGDGSGIQTTIFQKLMVTKLFRDYYTSAIGPISSSQMITFFLPSEQALSRIPQLELEGLSEKMFEQYFKMHYIPNRVVYTSFVNHQEQMPNGNADYGNANNDVVFMRNNNKVTVKSGQVVASIVHGNITVGNGVIHVIDTMLGFVYRTLIEQIKLDAPMFHSLLKVGLDSDLDSWLAQGSANIFVPNDMAMTRIRNLVNFNQNRTLIDFVVRLSLLKDSSIEVSQLNGNYAVRQHRISRYRDWKIVVYNDRNETWVNAGHVRAKILKPDIKTTTGTMQLIDAVLGVPSMDIPHLIYYDDYLLWTYYDLRSVGLVEYLRDPRFDNSSLPARTFDRNGFYQNPYNQQTTRSPYPNSNYPGNTNNNNYPNNNNPNYPNNYPSNNQNNQNYPNNQNTPYPNSNYPNGNNNQYPNNYPSNNNYPNQYQDPLKQPVANYGRCRSYANVCQFTYFVPNGSAIFNYKMTSYGRQIALNPNLYRYVLRRTLIMDNLVYLENMPINSRGSAYTTHTGDTITIAKENDNTARVSWLSGGPSGGLVTARVIMWDLGATNGVVHIIENVLSVSSDLSIDPSGAEYIKSSMTTVLCLCLVSVFYRLLY